MTVKDLIEQLTEACEEAGCEPGDLEVRLAIQPNYPFQHHIDRVVAVDLSGLTRREEEDEDFRGRRPEDGDENWVVFIGEGGQDRTAPYLPGIASETLGWR